MIFSFYRCNRCKEKQRLVAENVTSDVGNVDEVLESTSLLDKGDKCRSDSYTDDYDKGISTVKN